MNKSAKKENFRLCFLAILFIFQSAGRSVMGQDIEISLDGIETARGGNLLISLFKDGSGFPDNPSKAFKAFQFRVAGKFTLKNIPSGEYALALIHDFDLDKKMTYSMLGMPKDGFASSPDGGSAFIKPEFRKATFLHTTAGTKLRMKIHYFF